jgi:CTP synthase
MRIALIGDYNAAVKAHQAIPVALSLACESAGVAADWEWLHTETLLDDVSDQLAPFEGVWCVPASPYANTRGAIAAIRYARRQRKPFLGTCGGFQHALLEYAEDVWGVVRAAHAELDPDAVDPIIAPLECSLVDQAGDIRFALDSKLARAYGTCAAREEYHCRYGLSRHYAARLANGPLRATAWDAEGEVRGVELDPHPFFVATLFQPERSALTGRAHPLIRAYVEAAAGRQ